MNTFSVLTKSQENVMPLLLLIDHQSSFIIIFNNSLEKIGVVIRGVKVIHPCSQGVHVVSKDFMGYIHSALLTLQSHAYRAHATNKFIIQKTQQSENFAFLIFLFLLEIWYSNIMVWISLISIKISSFIAKGHVIAIFFTPTFMTSYCELASNRSGCSTNWAVLFFP